MLKDSQAKEATEVESSKDKPTSRVDVVVTKTLETLFPASRSKVAFSSRRMAALSVETRLLASSSRQDQGRKFQASRQTEFKLNASKG